VKTVAREVPRDRELLLLAGVTTAIVLTLVSMVGRIDERVGMYGDNGAYIEIADALRSGDLTRILEGHFLGLPVAIAAIGTVLRVSSMHALLFVSWASSLGAVLAARRLWGAGAAAVFAVISAEWLGRTALGGAEPLFTCLLLLGFVALRRDRTAAAALLMALATTVRPQGVLALFAIAADRALRRDWRAVAVIAGIAAAIGALYLALMSRGGDALGNVHVYKGDWRTRSPISWPFVALFRGYAETSKFALHSVKVAAWLALAIAGAVATLTRSEKREAARRHAAESIFAAVYLLFLVSYDSPEWSWLEFPRFLIPVLPFLIWALLPATPRVRWFAWAIAVPSALFAAMTAIGVRESVDLVARLLRS
jgi:hypothetical protein